MALKKKPYYLNINFNFSDDSDDDENNISLNNQQTKHNLKDLKNEINFSGSVVDCLHLAADNTIIACDYLNRHDLPPVSEDIGPPITESTLLLSSAVDSMYVTALEDSLNQSKPQHNVDTESRHVVQETLLKGNTFFTKGRLFACDKLLTTMSVDFNTTRLNNEPTLPVTPQVIKLPLESGFTDSVDEKTPHIDHELISESFVEIQDVSIQTSIIDDLYDSSKESEKSLHLNASCIASDSTTNDAKTVELSSYEVQDVSVQTSLLMNKENNVFPVCENAMELKNKLSEKSPLKSTDDTTNDAKTVELSSYEVHDISAQTSLFMNSESNVFPFHESMKGLKNIFLEKSLLSPSPKELLHYSVEYDNESSSKDDAGSECDILAADTESEDERNNTNVNNGHSEYAMNKIDESYFDELDIGDGGDVQSDREYAFTDDSNNENTKTVPACSELSTAAICYNSEEEYIDSNSTTDHAARLQETSTSANKDCDNNEDLAVKSLKTRQKSENFSSIQQRKYAFSSDDDDDSDFDNFLGKLKNSIKPQEPSRERMPLSEFIVDDEDDFSEDSDNGDDDELFYIKTTRELNKESSQKLYPAGYSKIVHAQLSSDDSDFEASDSDLDDFIDDKSPNKRSEKSKPVIFPKTPDRNTQFLLKETTCESFEDNNLPSKRSEESQFKIPRNVDQWKRPFQTPTRRHINKEDFKTPICMRGSLLQPATAPRSFGGTGVDDDSFFLKSLSAHIPDYKRHADAVRCIKFFKESRAELTQKLFKIFNSKVFEDKLPKDLRIEWSVRYTQTAGVFRFKKTQNNLISHVVLSVKVCDSPERLRDTLVHELCHAAVAHFNKVNENHGPIWKSWARKVNRTFPFLPLVTRCHNYTIFTKYTYQCINCKHRIGRHSKSLNTETDYCGICFGTFELYLTKELNSSNENCKTPVTPYTPRTPNKFALFVKEHYSEVKKRDELKHSEIMKILSQEFEKAKICN